jgi:C1A family cysteine protease
MDIYLIAVLLIFLGLGGYYYFNKKKKIYTYSHSTFPTFSRGYMIDCKDDVCSIVKFPNHFDSRDKWPGKLPRVYNQLSCDACWAFCSSFMYTARLRIKTNNFEEERISPHALAACIKCNNGDGRCTRSCSGYYVDETLDHLIQYGAPTESSMQIDNIHKKYVCENDMPKIKARRMYRVNAFHPSDLDEENLKRNELIMMKEIMDNGPITGIITIYKTNDHRNLYLHNSGIYGENTEGFEEEPSGYHSIVIVGWGTNGQTPYWICANSWGSRWGDNGYFNVRKGSNLGMIESDVYAIEP